MYRKLHEGWTMSATGTAAGAADDPRWTRPPHLESIPATVPGSVHTDLLAAGLIADPYVDDHELGLGWIGRTHWRYTTSFDWQDDGFDRVDLVCDGLDTIATIAVNGHEVGATANMHRRYRFDVRPHLRPGANDLVVGFTAPYEYAQEQLRRLGDRPGPYDEPYQFIRKMACNFGWDWGPTLVTAGIWRPIGLHSWSGARIAEVRPSVRPDGVDVTVAVERPAGRATPVAVSAQVGDVRVEGKAAAGQDELTLRVDVPEPTLWWPRGHGEPHLYDLTVTAGDDTRTSRVGLRSVELDPDAFRLIVNGEPVYVRGFNWIPDDPFPARPGPAQLRERFGQAVAAGANALRVWGGGLYESDAFYDLADELGLLVWQDFPFACAAYPEEEPFATEVEAEARDNIARLMGHPSLALWCGNNENIEGHQHWGWPAELGERTWGAGYYHDRLPRLVAELDPGRPYWPGTPYSGHPDGDVHDPATGTVHIWTVWGSADYTHFADYTPRFVAEFGFQGPPAYATLRAAVTDDPLTPDSPGVRHHQKAADGNRKLLTGLGEHLPQPSNFDDWHYWTQLNQARAMAFGVRRFRALMPYCMGTFVWQLNDCWPVTSWAAVDGAGRRKPLWYALRRAYAPRLLTFHEDGVALVNDTPSPWTGTLTLTLRDLDGSTVDTAAVAVSAAPRAVAVCAVPFTGAPAQVLEATFDGRRDLRFFAEDPQVPFPPADFDAHVTDVPGGHAVHVTARTVIRELALFPDRLHPSATVDDHLLTLLPGESVTLTVHSDAPLDRAALIRHPVLRCVNEPRPR
ncbi:glycoside hydrolase family 2 protein [Dactylosporangium matsuzakiense]|uniref:beta-mannosidase n=1 Tax=Dactylosporangium matsuzakiense TaxID=53360 RepID=A0A9W6KHV9_9ACTN|nr:glycoside hydrolase family 2 protein [Dactylosporangium matsuzakiense]UWZ41563.1 glycoside hydrolase family 2 protein [Dactylosporangium matsuzakiense]GLL02372.1 beta-mannosidase [Dactylosporangium matsuzakiense]